VGKGEVDGCYSRVSASEAISYATQFNSFSEDSTGESLGISAFLSKFRFSAILFSDLENDLRL